MNIGLSVNEDMHDICTCRKACVQVMDSVMGMGESALD